MIKSDEHYRETAIRALIGKIKIGDVVATHSHPLAHMLIDIIDNIGICELPDGEINKFPVSELFDINAVCNRAVTLKLLDGLTIDRRN